MTLLDGHIILLGIGGNVSTVVDNIELIIGIASKLSRR